MKLTNAQVLEVMNGLDLLGKEKIAMKLVWKIETARRSLEPFHKGILDTLGKIQSEWAEKDAAGNIVFAKDEKGKTIPNALLIPVENIPKFNSDVEDLLVPEIEVQNIEFRLSDFPETMELSPDIIKTLRPLFVD